MPRVRYSHFDRFYSFDELPKKEQKDHKDWASGDEQFVRMKYKNGRIEWIPAENFQRMTKSHVGRKADGAAADSYFSATFIRFLTKREQYGASSFYGPDDEYEVWMESW